MKLKEILQEAPLPGDWDKEAYKSDKSFASRLRYAQERAKKMGTGSSRVAFEIEHEGRPTILKIAKNKKGLAQNDFESQMFNDYYATSSGITIPMIDHDEENDPPTWIHTEKADKIHANSFKKVFGLDPHTFERYLLWSTGQIHSDHLGGDEKQLFDKIVNDEDNYELLHDLTDLVGNYGLPVGDFSRAANWGMYKGHPVIIDLGLSSDVLSQHYS
jgi:hypothetical protein